MYVVPVCGEDIEISENFTNFCSVMHNDGTSSQQTVRWIGLVQCCGLTHQEYLVLLVHVQMEEDSDPVIPVFLYGC